MTEMMSRYPHLSLKQDKQKRFYHCPLNRKYVSTHDKELSSGSEENDVTDVNDENDVLCNLEIQYELCDEDVDSAALDIVFSLSRSTSSDYVPQSSPQSLIHSVSNNVKGRNEVESQPIGRTASPHSFTNENREMKILIEEQSICFCTQDTHKQMFLWKT